MKKLIVTILVTSLFFMLSCEEERDSSKANKKIMEANKKIKDTIPKMQKKLNLPDCYDDEYDEYDIDYCEVDFEKEDMDLIDFVAASKLYKEAVKADPKNMDAQLGAAVLNILALLKDPNFVTLRNEWWGTEFRIYNLNSKKMKINAFLDTLLPAIDYSLKRLSILDQEKNKDYNYLFTSELSGIEDMDDVKIDMTDIKFFHATLLTLKTATLLMKTYKMFPDNSSLQEIKSALEKNGTFLTLISSNNGIKAYDNAVLAINKFNEALDSLRLENDDQENNLITKDLLEQQNLVLDIKEMLLTNYSVEEEDVKATIGIKDFMYNLPQNLKMLLPDYTVGIKDDMVKLDFNAESLEEAVFPDTTLGGLIKEQLSQEDFKILMGLEEDDSF